MRVGFMQDYDQERIEFAKRVGFRCLELKVTAEDTFVPGRDGWQAEADKLKNDYEQAGLRVSCLGGFYVNHMEPGRREEFAAYTRNVILLAEYIGVPVVAGFGGKLVDRPLEESVEPFRKIWSEHARFAEDHGVRIAFEHCPMGWHHLPPNGTNCICTPTMWERCFEAVGSDALGLEWDPSHLIGLMIDPIDNLKTWVSRVYHVHAKDAKVDRARLAREGVFAERVVEHCFPGLGDTDWALVVKELIRGGYRGDLNIEGWHDNVYCSRTVRNGWPGGYELTMDGEDLGLVLTYRHLSRLVDEA